MVQVEVPKEEEEDTSSIKIRTRVEYTHLYSTAVPTGGPSASQGTCEC